MFLWIPPVWFHSPEIKLQLRVFVCKHNAAVLFYFRKFNETGGTKRNTLYKLTTFSTIYPDADGFVMMDIHKREKGIWKNLRDYYIRSM